jgi:hypothetical protein
MEEVDDDVGGSASKDVLCMLALLGKSNHGAQQQRQLQHLALFLDRAWRRERLFQHLQPRNLQSHAPRLSALQRVRIANLRSHCFRLLVPSAQQDHESAWSEHARTSVMSQFVGSCMRVRRASRLRSGRTCSGCKPVTRASGW